MEFFQYGIRKNYIHLIPLQEPVLKTQEIVAPKVFLLFLLLVLQGYNPLSEV